ncbi:hypothetical protein YC2023_098135 [Brassica napus]
MGSSHRQRSSHLAEIKGKGILYEDDDAPIKLMDQDDTLIVNEFSLSLIGKILNPKKQNVDKLLQKMPSQWGIENRITANDLGYGKFLLNFISEEDLNSVLRQGPFHFNFCIFVLVRWEPIVHDDYPWIIPFKIQVIGIPFHLWTDKNLKNIGARIGHVHDDTHEVSEGRMLIDVDSRHPLKFTRQVESKDGDEVTIEIMYERLFKHCSTCGMLTHEKDHCPSLDMRTRLQQQTEHSDVFARMQPPQEQSHRHKIQNDHRANALTRQPYNHRVETSTGHLVSSWYDKEDRKFAQRKHHSVDLRAAHSDRVMRHRDDLSRSNIYGGSRASKGPYDRYHRQTWREKVETTRRPDTSSKRSHYERENPLSSSREIVPYEKSSGTSNEGRDAQQALKTGEGNSAKSAKRLASTIVMPS